MLVMIRLQRIVLPVAWISEKGQNHTWAKVNRDVKFYVALYYKSGINDLLNTCITTSH